MVQDPIGEYGLGVFCSSRTCPSVQTCSICGMVMQLDLTYEAKLQVITNPGNPTKLNIAEKGWAVGGNHVTVGGQ